MEKKYVIIRLDDTLYWGNEFWERNVRRAKLFDDRNYAERRITGGYLIEEGEHAVEGICFEIKEIFVKK